MDISNNISSMQNYQTMMNNSASKIANGNADLAKEIPKQIVAQDATEVNATVIKTQDDMLGTLLDMKA